MHSWSPGALRPRRPPDGAFQDVGIALFDRDSLRGWRTAAPEIWSVGDEAIIAATSRKETSLKYTHPIEGAFRLHLSITPLGHGPSDGKMVQGLDSVGRFVSVSLDDDVPGTLAIYADGAPGGRKRRMGGIDVPVEIERATAFTITVEPGIIRVEHASRVISVPFDWTPPLRLQLAAQRTGARFRGLVLSAPQVVD